MKRFLIIAGGLVLLILALLNVLLLSQNRALRVQIQQPNRNEPSGTGLLRLTSGLSPFCRMVLQEKGKEARRPALSLLIFLRQSDCPACLEEAEVWDRLYKRYSKQGFLVLGMVPESDSLWVDQWAEEHNFSFPVGTLDSTILDFLGIPPVTPFKVMVDSLQRLVHISIANSGARDQKSFAEVAEKLCQVYLQGN